MTDLETLLRETLHDELDPVLAAPGRAGVIARRAKRHRAFRAAVAAVAAATVAVGAVAVAGRVREGADRLPPAGAPEVRAVFAVDLQGSRETTVAVDVRQGQACYSTELPFAASGALRRDDRGPEDPAVATFPTSLTFRKQMCAVILPADAERLIADPGLYYLEFDVAMTRVQGALEAWDVPSGEAPDVAAIVCGQHGAVALTPEVRPQHDGVHLRIHNHLSEVAELYLLAPNGDNEGGTLRRREVENVSRFPPGPLYAGCFADEDDIPYFDLEDRAFARITIVDPYGLWTEVDLECGEGDRRPVIVTDESLPSPVGVIPNFERLIREHVPGVGPDDDLVRPGYPESPFHFEPRTVVRDGRRIAGLMLVREGETWGIVPHVCPGSGIAEP